MGAGRRAAAGRCGPGALTAHWHMRSPMAWRKDACLNAERSRTACHAHGAPFAIDTGLCTPGPSVGQRLRPVALTLNPAGEVHLAPGTSLETFS
jgi:nitrite reductase/ring-hydroxylating ferredoxin subunit